MTTRVCCCNSDGGGGQDNCECVYGTFAPAQPSVPFQYRIEFPGYDGGVRIQQDVTNAEVRLKALPGTGYSGLNDFGGLYCTSGQLRLNCQGCQTLFTFCTESVNANQEPPLSAGPLSVIEEIGIETTSYPCGVELTESSGVHVACYLFPVPQTCYDEYVSKICINNDCVPFGGCADGCNCWPTAWDVQENECVTPTFWVKGNEQNCWPWFVYSTQITPGLVVTPPQSTTAIMTMNWNGSTLSNFTYASDNPRVTVDSYRHRVATTEACRVGGQCTTSSLNGTQRIYSDCDTDVGCCCMSEVTIRVAISQTYRARNFVNMAQLGVTGPTYTVQNILFATYRGCEDSKLYDNSAGGLATRIFRLHKVRLTDLPGILPTLLYNGEWTRMNNYIPQPECELTLNPLWAGGFGSLAAWKQETYSNVQEPTTCLCDSAFGTIEVPAEVGEQWGFPISIFVDRVTPA